LQLWPRSLPAPGGAPHARAEPSFRAGLDTENLSLLGTKRQRPPSRLRRGTGPSRAARRQ
jgi:hypothetical protein